MCIGAMNHLYSHRSKARVLIVCPNSLKFNWKKEFGYSDVEWDIHILQGSGADKKLQLERINRTNNGRCVVITNYESLSPLVKTCTQYAPDLIIADEAHNIKNHRAQKTKALKAIPAKLKWALTGTPVLNSPLDLWSIVDWVKKGHFSPNFYAFRNRYALIYTGAGFPIIKGYINQDELKKKVDVLSYRVTKDECLDLPEKTFIERFVTLSKDEYKIYKDMAHEMVASIGEEEVAASIILVKLLRLQQITSGFLSGEEGKVIHVGNSKLNALQELLEELEGQKVIIWINFKEEYVRINKLLHEMKLKTFRLISEDSSEERQQNVDGFQSTIGPCIMLGSTRVGGVGVTLTAASHAVYFSNRWSYGDRLQSQDRCYRIGQVQNVTYHDLLVENSIDTYIMKKLKLKQSISDKLTGDDLKKIAFDND